MAYDFSTVVNRKGSGSVKWAEMLGKKENVKDGIVPLSVADMEFKIAPEISEGLAEYARQAIVGYSAPEEPYFASVINWMQKRHGYQVEKDWIVPSPGVVTALFAAVQAYTRPGDGVIIMTPVYYPFYMAVERANRQLVENPMVNTNGIYTVDFEDLEEKASRKDVTMLILCSPHNPVGRVFSSKELEKIAKICLANDILMVVDEIHHDLVMPGHTHTAFGSLGNEIADRCVICTAPSKTFNLAGLQASNIIIKNEQLRRKFKNILESIGFFTLNAFGIKACELAYSVGGKWLDELIPVLDANRQLVEDYAKAYIPKMKVSKLEGTYLQWCDLRFLNLDEKKLEQKMISADLFFDEGYIFGKEGSGFERINIACPKDVLQKALERLKAATHTI
ncbi:MAG: MalY/PatB family protein [Christensenellaceae bacterium]|jgi:cystathionine beta-lyase